MPRQPDPELEGRILHAADVLWRRGGEQALTMRAVAKAAPWSKASALVDRSHFAAVRRHLGVETQRQWSDPAIARTTPPAPRNATTTNRRRPP